MRHQIAPLVLAALCVACGPGNTSSDAGPEPFIAVQHDFACYRTWPAFDGGTSAFDGLAEDNQRTLYINKLPPHGSTEFPVGTIIVKETATQQTFAMAKRGFGFNPAVNDWEWFGLTVADAGSPTACTPLIDWYGTSPPVASYGATLQNCNGCHAQVPANDDVQGGALSLSQF